MYQDTSSSSSSCCCCRGVVRKSCFGRPLNREAGPIRVLINPFRDAVSFWGQTTQISSSFSPKRDCGSKRGSSQLDSRSQPLIAVVPTDLRTALCDTSTGRVNPLSTAVPIWGQTFLTPSDLSPKQGWGPKRVNPFRTAVPFWGQTSQISNSLSPKRDCGSEGVKR